MQRNKCINVLNLASKNWDFLYSSLMTDWRQLFSNRDCHDWIWSKETWLSFNCFLPDPQFIREKRKHPLQKRVWRRCKCSKLADTFFFCTDENLWLFERAFDTPNVGTLYAHWFIGVEKCKQVLCLSWKDLDLKRFRTEKRHHAMFFLVGPCLILHCERKNFTHCIQRDCDFKNIFFTMLFCH